MSEKVLLITLALLLEHGIPAVGRAAIAWRRRRRRPGKPRIVVL